MRERANRLARYCVDRVGDSLRLVAVYDAEGGNDEDPDVVYAREDLRERYTSENLGRLLDYAAGVHDNIVAAGENADMLGEAEASVYVFENAFVMQFIPEAESGIIVSFDPEAGTYLSEFVTACLEQVR
jgi:hypothetical protein